MANAGHIIRSFDGALLNRLDHDQSRNRAREPKKITKPVRPASFRMPFAVRTLNA
jgi:hypothetical protein